MEPKKKLRSFDDKCLLGLPVPMQLLIQKGQEQGFVTYQELLKAMPEAEDNLDTLDEIYGIFMDFAIEILDAKDAVFNPEQEKEFEKKPQDRLMTKFGYVLFRIQVVETLLMLAIEEKGNLSAVELNLREKITSGITFDKKVKWAKGLLPESLTTKLSTLRNKRNALSHAIHWSGVRIIEEGKWVDFDEVFIENVASLTEEVIDSLEKEGAKYPSN